MQLFGKCCSSCKFGKLVMRPGVLGYTSKVWCKKHREDFEVNSCCARYEEKQIDGVKENE